MTRRETLHWPTLSRRNFLSAAGASLALPFVPGSAVAAPRERASRQILSFEHLHTGEALTLTYTEDGLYLAEVLPRLAHLLRDHYTDGEHAIDPALLDLLDEVQRRAGSRAPYQVISGYRSPRTHARLRAEGHRARVLERRVFEPAWLAPGRANAFPVALAQARRGGAGGGLRIA